MRVIVAGSRRGISQLKIIAELDRLKDTLPITEIVSGCARGVDTFGIQWANSNKIPTKLFPAEWARPDGSIDMGAGFKRNIKMAKYADVLAAFWDGKSAGSKHMIKLAADTGMTTFLFNSSSKERAFYN